MSKFVDNCNREWLVSINVAAVRRLRDRIDVDLYRLADDGLKSLSDLLNDPCKLVDVIYVLCEAQAKERGITDEQFGEGLGGDSLNHASDAFVEGLVNFFPDPKARAALRKAVAKAKDLSEVLIREAEAEIEGVSVPELVQKFRDATPEIFKRNLRASNPNANPATSKSSSTN